MTEIDPLMVDKLIESEYEPISQIGWRLYNRKKQMNIEELNEIGALIVAAFDENENDYERGYEKGYTEGLEDGKVEGEE
jgi:flagellar biosynthesis/type III secretory pathway protein FliH